MAKKKAKKKKATKKVAKRRARKDVGPEKPCNCKADRLLRDWFGPGSPAQPNKPKAKVGTQPWAHKAFESYVDLWLAVARLEKLADKQGWPNDEPTDRLTDPYGDKAGCPPPPAFP